MATPIPIGFVNGGEDFNLGLQKGDKFGDYNTYELDQLIPKWELWEKSHPEILKQMLDEKNPYYAQNKKEYDTVQAWRKYKSGGDEMSKAVAAQVDQAKSFRERLPLFRQQLGYDVDVDASKQLASQMTDINRNANRRGLLYSGLRANEARKAGVAAKAQGNEKKIGVNKDLSNISNELDQAVANTGLKTAAQKQAEVNANLSDQQRKTIDALKRRNGDNAALGGLIGAGASIVGEALA